MMSNQLLAAIKRRKKKMEGDDSGSDQEEQKQASKPQPQQIVHSKGFDSNKAKLQAFFKQKNGPEESVVIEKQEPKGNEKNFNNARALLEQNLGGGGSSLPPPPPPPPSGHSAAKSSLPPPPPPPPLSLNTPSLAKSSLPPPPPPFSAPSSKSEIPKPNLPPPPPVSTNPLPTPTLPTNLPPPPPPTQPAKSAIVPPPLPNLPPPPPPSQSAKSTVLPPQPPPPSQPTVLPPPPPPQPTQNVPSSPPQEKSSKPRIDFGSKVPPSSIEESMKPVKTQNKVQAGDCFVISEGKQSTKIENNPSSAISGSSQKQVEKSKRKKIFTKNDNKQYPLTKQILDRNLAALIKKQFLKTADINRVIGLEVHKNQYQFHFPSIQTKRRQVQPIQTLYADTNLLDLVSCFMNKNPQGQKPHKDQRDTLIAGFQDYNWETDKLKLKQIRGVAQVLPDSNYQEPNFIAIKTAITRTESLIETLVQSHDYARCDSLQKLITKTQKCLKEYCTNPDGNLALLQEVEACIAEMKSLTI